MKTFFNMSAFIAANPGFDSDKADILAGMSDRKFSADLGLNADIHLGQGTLATKFQHDVTGVYKASKLISLTITQST
ncbi:outer membrane protein ompV [Vibrio ishigakensis]|uniref:Outer membrane protein ompV n=1 Tax=Vibrio ishigakensis TaxID=1481914 RepID=A0A0B8P3D3_9VIBR|nr:outer membrane protein ompV [Vibrio ishigakensis]